MLGLLFGLGGGVVIAAAAPLILDDRRGETRCASNGACWRAVTDGVMGGLSTARLQPARVEGRACLRLTGEVSLENQGGFLQASLDLSEAGPLDARGYAGVEIEVYGNGESYNLHLRSADTSVVWQSYRASFIASPNWRTVRLPFDRFQPHRIERPLDLSNLRRLGVVAIGRRMRADVCIARLSLSP